MKFSPFLLDVTAAVEILRQITVSKEHDLMTIHAIAEIRAQTGKSVITIIVADSEPLCSSTASQKRVTIDGEEYDHF